MKDLPIDDNGDSLILIKIGEADFRTLPGEADFLTLIEAGRADTQVLMNI